MPRGRPPRPGVWPSDLVEQQFAQRMYGALRSPTEWSTDYEYFLCRHADALRAKFAARYPLIERLLALCRQAIVERASLPASEHAHNTVFQLLDSDEERALLPLFAEIAYAFTDRVVSS